MKAIATLPLLLSIVALSPAACYHHRREVIVERRERPREVIVERREPAREIIVERPVREHEVIIEHR